MDRRSFLRGLGMMVAGVAIDQAIPLGRVWSFPSKIEIAHILDPNCPPGRIDLLCSDTIGLQLEKVRQHLPLLYERDDRLFRMFSDRDEVAPFDPYNLRARLEEALADDTGFRITGITVPQGE